MRLVPLESIRFQGQSPCGSFVSLIKSEKQLGSSWQCLQGPDNSGFVARCWGHRFIKLHKKMLFETSQHSNSSTGYVSDFNFIHVPSFCFNMNIPYTASASPKVRVLQKCLWSKSPTGVIFTTYFTGFLFGALARQQWVGLRHTSKGSVFPSFLYHKALQQPLCKAVVITPFMQSQCWVASVFGERLPLRKADVQQKSLNSPGQRRSDGLSVLTSAYSVAG